MEQKHDYASRRYLSNNFQEPTRLNAIEKLLSASLLNRSKDRIASQIDQAVAAAAPLDTPERRRFPEPGKGPCPPLLQTFPIHSTKRPLYRFHTPHTNTRRQCRHARRCSACCSNIMATHHYSSNLSLNNNHACDKVHAPSATLPTMQPVCATTSHMRRNSRILSNRPKSPLRS